MVQIQLPLRPAGTQKPPICESIVLPFGECSSVDIEVPLSLSLALIKPTDKAVRYRRAESLIVRCSGP